MFSNTESSCQLVPGVIGLALYKLFFNYNPAVPGSTGAMLTKKASLKDCLKTISIGCPVSVNRVPNR
jgi:hypothetical protein